MMPRRVHFVPLGFLAFPSVIAGPAPGPMSTTKQCVELQVPIPVVATNLEFDIPRVDNNIDAAGWVVNTTTWSMLISPESRVINHVNITRTFSINAQLCVPPTKGPKSEILQIATAGNGFDKRYWDVEINPEKYSYLDAAIKKGYSVLTYDKLGSGKSEKPNGYTMVQIPSEIEVLAGLTKLARAGKLISSSKVLSGKPKIADFKPSKIVQVAHSYGSVLVQGVLSKYGNLSDGALLTGFYLSKKQGIVNVGYFDHEFPKEHDPVRFRDYPSGYIVLTTKLTLQKVYFHFGGFEPKLLDYTEKIKQPETVGVYGSEATLQFSPAPDFKGPVKVFAGQYDYVNCAGDCNGTNMEDAGKILFPATNVTYELVPNTGHALTLASSGPHVAQSMLQFLEDNGL